eukprot:5632236-Pyramimonas_sp.AAC.1
MQTEQSLLTATFESTNKERHHSLGLFPGVTAPQSASAAVRIVAKTSRRRGVAFNNPQPICGCCPAECRLGGYTSTD